MKKKKLKWLFFSGLLFTFMCFSGKEMVWANSEIVVIEDPVLEKVVRSKVNKPSGDLVQTDLEKLTTLELDFLNLDGRIYSLKGLEHAKNLSIFRIVWEDFLDPEEFSTFLSPLYELESLQTLGLRSTYFSDISFFSNFKNLKEVYVDSGPNVSIDDYVMHLGNIDKVYYNTDDYRKQKTIFVSNDRLTFDAPVKYQGKSFNPSYYSSSNLSLSGDYQTFSVIAGTEAEIRYRLTETDLNLSGKHDISLNYGVLVFDDQAEETQNLSLELLVALKKSLGKDLKITDQLVSKITHLDLSRQNITDFTGLSNFKRIKILDVSHNGIQELSDDIVVILDEFIPVFDLSYNKISNIGAVSADTLMWAEGTNYRFDNQSPEFEGEIIDNQLVIPLEGHPDAWFECRYFNFSHGQFDLDSKTLTFSEEDLSDLRKTKAPITFSFSQVLSDDFYTGKMIYDGVATIHLTSINGAPVEGEVDETVPEANTSDVTINGTIQPMIVSVDIPSQLNFVIDPNSKTQAFVSPEFRVVNESNTPLRLSLMKFEQPNPLLVDVLPTQYTDEQWQTLSTTDSKQVAIGLQAVSSDNQWLNLGNGKLVYAKEIQEGTKSWLGDVRPNSTIDFCFTAKHGLAFESTLNPVYHLTFLFDLLG